MLSILPFERVAGASSQRDSDRPFKSYPRTSNNLSNSLSAHSSLYSPYAPPTFIGSVGVPAPHTKLATESSMDLRAASSQYGDMMDSMSQHHHHQHRQHQIKQEMENHYNNSLSNGYYHHHGYGSSMPHIPSSNYMSTASAHSAAASNGVQQQASLQQQQQHTSPGSTGAAAAQSPPNGSELAAPPQHQHNHPSSSSSSTTPVPIDVKPLDSSATSTTSSTGSPDHGHDSLHNSPCLLPRKPQPPKKRSNTVPVELKDDQYWDKRKKNNESAKRSREARRCKEEQIAMRVVYLEQENLQLRTEVSLLKSEIEKLRCMLYQSA